MPKPRNMGVTFVEEKYLSPKEAAKKLGIHPLTLYRWTKAGKIRYIKTPGGRFKYPLSEIERILKKPRVGNNVVIYARVAYPNQVESGELNEQVNQLLNYAKEKGYNIVDVITDVGSGISSNRPGLKKLIEMAESGKINKVLVIRKDRMVRTCLWLLEELFRAYNIEIESLAVQNEKYEKEFYLELVDWLLQLLETQKEEFKGKLDILRGRFSLL